MRLLSSTFRRALLVAFSLLVPVATALTFASSGAGAGAGQSAQVSISPATQTHASGTPFTFSVALSCQGTVGSACGPHAVVHIPLSLITTPAMTDSSWGYNASSSTVGLISSQPQVVGNELQIGIDSTIFASGYSGTVVVRVTPPDFVTPNNTTWSFTPSLSSDTVTTVQASAPAVAIVSAAPVVSVTNTTIDNSVVFEANKDIAYVIIARCSPTPNGSLQLTSASLVDTLPAGMTYVSSSPAGTYNAGAHTVTWTFASGNDPALPTGCAPSAAATNVYKIVVHGPATVPTVQPWTNTATFRGTGPDATNPSGVSTSTNASVAVNFVQFPPVTQGWGYPVIYKFAKAPLPQSGVTGDNSYIATYPGDWMPTSSTPDYASMQFSGAFQSKISTAMTGIYYLKVIDPVPCLDNAVGNRFESPSPTGPACAHPAFHTTVVAIRSTVAPISISSGANDVNGVGRATTEGWRPTAVLSDGSTITLQPTGTYGVTSNVVFFTVPAGKVAAKIEMPPNQYLRPRYTLLQIFGYAVDQLRTLNGGQSELKNVTTAWPQTTPGHDLSKIENYASLFVVPQKDQLGVSTSFGALGAAGNGTTAMTISGQVTSPAALTHDIVVTDLLPLGLTWENPGVQVQQTILNGIVPRQTTMTITVTSNYRGSGRDLIRITIPRSAFPSAGTSTFTINPSVFHLATPLDYGVYTNTVEIFEYDLAPLQIRSICATPGQEAGGIPTGVFTSDNSLDLAGDGHLSEQFCRASADLAVTGSGAAFSLTKAVQGNLDSLELGALGVGKTSPQGTGTFTLRWNNVGSDTLSNPVIYDVLPYVGDTGVSSGQHSVTRLSDFAVSLLSIKAPKATTVYYSPSHNPCRPEVFANADNTGCVSDWTSVAPSDLSTVNALKFVTSGTYARTEGFTISYDVKMPATTNGQVAWNSAATNATDVTSPSTHPLPAEPPKVGLSSIDVAGITTHTSRSQGVVGDQITDHVSVTGLLGHSGTLSWTFLGPVAPVSGSCAGVDWSTAPVIATGQMYFTDHGDQNTPEHGVSAPGCYSFADSLTYELTAGDPVTVSSAPSTATEVSLISVESQLPFTGFDAEGLALWALLVIAVGVGFVLASRRLS